MQKPVNYNSNTTDPQDEQLCHVTKDDKLIGPIERKICHNETTRPWHRTAHLYLFDTKGRLYLTQRSLSKDTAPGKWTVSAGGHVNFGQTYAVAMREETRQELGLKVRLKMLDKLTIDFGTEREMIAIFAGITNKKPNVNREEILKIKAFAFDKIVKKFQEGEFDLSNGSRDTFKLVIKTVSLQAFREEMLKVNKVI